METKDLNKAAIVPDIYPDANIRSKIIARIGNKIIADEKAVATYNAVCAIVKKYDVWDLLLLETAVEFSMRDVNITISYTNDTSVEWLEEKIKFEYDVVKYNDLARSKGVYVLTNKRSNELVKAIEFALAHETEITKDDNDNVTVTTEVSTYRFNLYNVSFKHRKRVDDMFKLKRMEALAKKHGIKI